MKKSIRIKVPLDKVWNQVNSLKASAKWSPWIEKDPYMQQQYKGEDGKPGAKYSWDSNERWCRRSNYCGYRNLLPELILSDLLKAPDRGM